MIVDQFGNDFMATAFNMGTPITTDLYGATLNEAGQLPISAAVSGTDQSETLEANVWLPRAAEYHGLSKKISDYILIAVPAMITRIPNTNGDSVDLKQFTAWNEPCGRLAYKTWEGRPMYIEHQHSPEWVRGLIFGTYMRPTPFKNIQKLVMLGALDRTRDPRRCERVLKRELNTYSMGMLYNAYTCSVCGHTAGKGIGSPCAHTRPRKPTYQLPDGRLAYRRCMNITGYELSLLENVGGRHGQDGYTQGFGDPSYVSAIGDIILDPKSL
jgi:hypothetical protein|uniref:Uncharacterized protein n=1 Tax=Myoviridae sp. ctshb19 TaxID=2825194 RepID=A0A8S5UH21_9CAUD|nr:MAG TPA: hypothetical protein [Myoviridae sp. ctshb19]